MKVLVANSDLDFLTGGFEALAARFPIVVVSAARRKCIVLKAIPEPSDLQKWKSLDYQKIDEGRGSVHVIDEWRMHLRDESTNEQESTVAITGLRTIDES